MAQRKPVLPETFWIELAGSCPTGEPITAELVRSWFDITYPTMLAHYRGTANPRWKQRIAKWFVRVRPEELARARERLAAIDGHAEGERLQKIYDSLESKTANIRAPVRLLKVRGGRTS